MYMQKCLLMQHGCMHAWTHKYESVYTHTCMHMHKHTGLQKHNYIHATHVHRCTYSRNFKRVHRACPGTRVQEYWRAKYNYITGLIVFGINNKVIISGSPVHCTSGRACVLRPTEDLPREARPAGSDPASSTMTPLDLTLRPSLPPSLPLPRALIIWNRSYTVCHPAPRPLTFWVLRCPGCLRLVTEHWRLRSTFPVPLF